MGIAPLEVRYVCTHLHRSAEFRKLHYFVVPQWEGSVEHHEAASLRWVPSTAPHDLDVEVDRLALAEYQRVYGVAWHQTHERAAKVLCRTTQCTGPGVRVVPPPASDRDR